MAEDFRRVGDENKPAVRRAANTARVRGFGKREREDFAGEEVVEAPASVVVAEMVVGAVEGGGGWYRREKKPWKLAWKVVGRREREV